MSLRWRIRHKLSLGLGLNVVVMALLLGGTLNGFWSFYRTTSILRTKMSELRVAEDFKQAVAQLVSRDNLKRLKNFPQEIRGEQHGTTRIKSKLAEYVRLVKENQAYQKDKSAAENASGRRDPYLWALDVATVILPQKIEDFEKSWDKDWRPTMDTPGSPNSLGEDFAFDLDDSAEARKMRKDRQVKFLSESAGFVLPDIYPRLTLLFLSNEIEGAVNRAASSLTFEANDLYSEIYSQMEIIFGESRRNYQVSFWIIFPASIFGLLLMAGLMRSFYAWVFNPIRDLENGVNRVANGDFEHRIDVNSGDEMEDLGKAFNEMIQRLQDLYSDLARQVNERSRQLVRSERLASVGFLAAGVAHEINNPLASIAFCSEALEARLGEMLRLTVGRSSEEKEVFSKYLKMIQEEAFRCKSITERLLAFSRTGDRKRESTDLATIIQAVLDITQHLQNSRGKHISFEKMVDRNGNGKIVAPVNSEEIKSVVLNLVVNALDSMEGGGHLTIQLLQRDGMAEIRFHDTGCGMTQEVLENIFEPFFTRSRTGKGTGLGLTISHRIINQHGGEIEAMSDGPNQGSTFVVRLPLQVVEPASPMPSSPGNQERSGKEGPKIWVPKGKAA